MKITADTSVWIDFFRGSETPATVRLRDVFGKRRSVVFDLVITETLQGFTDDREFRLAHDRMLALPTRTTGGVKAAVQAARNYRSLRARGITPRKTIDTLIATRCIIDDIALLYSDRDFDPFVAHLGLRSALDEPL